MSESSQGKVMLLVKAEDSVADHNQSCHYLKDISGRMTGGEFIFYISDL